MQRDITPERDPHEHRTPERLAESREVPQAPPPREPELLRLRGSTYRVSSSQLETLGNIGRFRTVAVDDLVKFRYQGNARALRDDLRAVAAQGLVRTRSVAPQRRGAKTLPVAVLTKVGKELLEARGLGEQRVFAGFVKAREVRHDAAIYRMYQAERLKIERAGGHVKRIVLDYELKERIYRPLATLRSQTPAISDVAYAKAQSEVACQNGLTVVDGKIPLPDLRLEYETREGDLTRVDLELATGHYHGGAMAAKAQAGFTFYAADGSGAQLSRVLEERDITVAILSL